MAAHEEPSLRQDWNEVLGGSFSAALCGLLASRGESNTQTLFKMPEMQHILLWSWQTHACITDGENIYAIMAHDLSEPVCFFPWPTPLEKSISNIIPSTSHTESWENNENDYSCKKRAHFTGTCSETFGDIYAHISSVLACSAAKKMVAVTQKRRKTPPLMNWSIHLDSADWRMG